VLICIPCLEVRQAQPAAASAWSPTATRPARPTPPSRSPGAAHGGAPNGRRYRVEACEGHRPKTRGPPPRLAASHIGGRLGAGKPGALQLDLIYLALA
jgi:hypothetical protein